MHWDSYSRPWNCKNVGLRRTYDWLLSGTPLLCLLKENKTVSVCWVVVLVEYGIYWMRDSLIAWVLFPEFVVLELGYVASWHRLPAVHFVTSVSFRCISIEQMLIVPIVNCVDFNCPIVNCVDINCADFLVTCADSKLIHVHPSSRPQFKEGYFRQVSSKLMKLTICTIK